MPPDAYKGMAPDGKAQFMGKGGPDKGFGGKGDFDGKDGKGFGGKEPFMGKDMDGKGFGGKDPMVISFFFWIERNRRSLEKFFRLLRGRVRNSTKYLDDSLSDVSTPYTSSAHMKAPN